MSQKIHEDPNKSTSKFSIKSMWNSVFEDINNDVLFSGKPLDTLVFLEKLRKSIIISAIILAPVSIFLSAIVSPIFLALNLISILIFAYPKIQQSSLSRERKKKVEEELPSFVIFSSVLQNVGVGLYDSFQLFGQTGVFKSIGKEALLLKRNVEQFGISQMEALEELGRTHKSDQFKNLLLGYTSIWRSGGDLSLYLESRAEEFFTNLKDRYQTYTTNVGTIVEVLVTLLIILPIMIMVSSFVLPGSSMEQVTILATVGIPIFAILMGVAISSMQPASFNMLGLHPRTTTLLVAIGIISGSLSFHIFSQTWLAIALGLLIPSTISAIITGRQTTEINRSEHSLPQFLRDMTEYKKIGYDILLAMIHLSKENLYNSIFNKKIGEVSILLDNGISPITSVKSVQFRSWFTKISFYLLGYVAEFGGGNPRTLETVNKFITTAKQVVKEGKSSISMLTIVVFAAPVIMAFTATMILGIMDSFDSSLFASSNKIENPFGNSPEMNKDFTNLITITPQFLEMTKTLIITSSMLSAFVISKAIDFSFYSTWRVVVIGVIAIISVIMMDSISGINLSLDNIIGSTGL